MKQLFAIFVMVLMTLGVNAQNSNVIAEKDWTGCTEDDLLWYQFGDGQQGSVTATDDGIAISIPTKSEVPYEPQTTIIDNFSLVEGHSYVVRISVKIPSDGQLQVNMGDWNGNEQDFFDVTGSEDFQELEIEFPNYPYTINSDAHILFQSGFIVGTCVVKKVQVIDKEVMQSSTPTITANAITIEAGGEADLVMTYESENDMTGAQFTITLPDGITIKKNDNKFAAALGKEIEEEGYIWTISDGNASNTVMVYRNSATVPALTSGVNLITLTLVADVTAVSGNAKISGIVFSDKGTSVNGNEDFEIAITVPSAPVANPEPYAVLSDNNNVVTFYYDDQKAARGGMDINNSYLNDNTNSPYGSATTAVIDASFADYLPTSTAFWFSKCSSLTSITGIENLKTDNVTYMGDMFGSCSGLTSLDLSGFNTQKVTNMYCMFYGCSNLTSLDLSGFNTQNVTNMYRMFDNCSSLTSLDLSGFNTQNMTDMRYMFYGCSGLTSLDLSGFNTQKVTDMQGMFYGCSSLTSLNLSGFNTQNVTNMYCLFADCSGLTSLDLSGFNTQNVTNMSYMFTNCSGLTSLDLSGFNTQNGTDMSHMFRGCSNLTSLDLSGFNTKKVTNMQSMFSGCSGLTSLDVTGFNTQNVTDMNHMFYGCSGLTSLDLSGFNTQNVTNMSYMFTHCSGMTSLEVTGFNTKNVTDMNCMYYGCSGLTSLNVSGFQTDNVTNMAAMFSGCSSLTSLDVTHFDTQNVTDMSGFFHNCSGLTSLDLSSFNTSKVLYNENNYIYGIREMFYGCSKLTTIFVSEGWTTANLTQSANVFLGCTNLVGGAGTHYDASHTYYTYAHIDGGTTNPGYFTAAGAEPWKEPNEPEPYAVLSDNNTVLTFYYDDQKAARNGMEINNSYIGDNSSSPYGNATTAVIDASFADYKPTSTAYWFMMCPWLTTINGMENLNTQNVTDMGYMFYRCSSLPSLDLTGFNTQNVTNMRDMFDDCSGLTSLDVTGFNTQNVTNMWGMFGHCSGLTSLDLSGFNTQNVTDMGGMFADCSGLTSLDVTGFNTQKVTNMPSMFAYCSGLTSLDVSGFNTKNVWQMYNMFGGCSGLTTIYVGNEWSTASVTEGTSMFYGCTSLVGGKGTTYDENHTDHTYAHIDGGTANPGYFTAAGAEPWKEPDINAVVLTGKINNYWYDATGTSNNGFESIILTIPAPTNDPNAYDTSVWESSVLNTFVNNQLAFTTVDGDEVNNVTAQILFESKDNMVATDDGKTLRYVNGNEQGEVATIEPTSGMIHIVNSETTRRLLNKSDAEFMAMPVCVKAYINDQEVTVTNGSFTVFARKPLKAEGKAIQVASLDGGTNTYELIDLVKISDWRGVELKSSTNIDMFEYYRVKSITVGGVSGNADVINLVKTDLGSEDGSFGPLPATYSVTQAPTELQKKTNGNNIVTDSYGTLSIQNNGDAIIDGYSLQIPLTITYEWGSMEVVTTIRQEQGQIPVQDPEPYAVLSDNNTVLTFYYDDQKEARGGMDIHNTFVNISPYESAITAVIDASFADYRPTSTASWFIGCSSLTSIMGMENLNTQNVTDMAFMFWGCSSLTSLDLAEFDTQNVRFMERMFSGCSSLTGLDVSKFKTDNVTGMAEMFYGCSGLTSLDVTGFKTDNVTDMGEMFYGCSGLTSLDVTGFNTKNVTRMQNMFDGCSGLTSLDLSSFNTENVSQNGYVQKIMGDYLCHGIVSMFSGCSKLTTIFVGDGWTTANLTESPDVFTGCTHLVGGAGTHYDADHTDYTYAHIDGGTENPGYFTAAGAEPWSGSEPVVVSLINNGDMEGNENSNFFVRYEAMGDQYKEASKATITNGVGVNGSRGVKVEAKAKMVEKWDNQFWFRLNQPVSAGTKVRLSFDYRADTEATITTESHEEPTVYIYYNPFGGDINFSKDWSHFEYEGTMDSYNSTDQLPFQSMAFTLNSYFEEPNNYYFDNVKFEVIMEDQCPKPTFKRTENTVTIQSPFDATIYYTLDGKEPTTNSSVYTAPLSFTQSTTIMAIAVVDGYEVSPVATYQFEPTEDNLDQKREELIAMIYQLAQEVDVCYKELGMKDPDQTSDLWKDIAAIEDAIATVKAQTDEATTEEQLDDCVERINQIAYEVQRLRKEIEMYAPVNVSFDGLTAWVSGGATLDDAFAEAGGREVAARTIAAIIWENSSALTADMLEGIDNPNLLVYVNEASLAPQGIQNVVINGQAKEIILTNATTGNNNFFCPQPFRVEKISYTRNFSQQTEVGVSQGWEGIALPFNVQSITHETKGAIAPFGSGTGVKHFWLRTLSRNGMTSATSIEAYKPYVISMPNNTTAYPQEYNLDGNITFSAMNVDVPDTPEMERMSANNGNYTMVSAFQAVAQSDSIYAINVGQARANYAEGSVFEAGLREVRPFEVYTVHNGQGARPRFMPIQGNSDTMSIENIENEFSTLNSKWYDLNGRKLSTEPKRKGIYIQNGRQQIVR